MCLIVYNDEYFDDYLYKEFDPYTKKLDWTTKSCRQVAYEHSMPQIVELIDQMNGQLWPFLKVSPRVPRLRRTPSERGRGLDADTDSSDDSDSRDSDVTDESLSSDTASVKDDFDITSVDSQGVLHMMGSKQFTRS